MAEFHGVAQSWKVGVDVGGTFTDVVAMDAASGAVRTAKTLTRAKDPAGGMAAAFRSVQLDLGDVSDLILGTTMATNAIVEGRLARAVLITTQGLHPGLGGQWLRSCATTWPVAFPTVTIVAPWVRRFVGRVTA